MPTLFIVTSAVYQLCTKISISQIAFQMDSANPITNILCVHCFIIFICVYVCIYVSLSIVSDIMWYLIPISTLCSKLGADNLPNLYNA